jgi:alpha-mannosidase
MNSLSRFLSICGLSIAFTATAFGQDAKRYYIANDDHTDYEWSADADTYANCFVDLIDFHLRLAGLTANNPSEYKNRFNCDGSFWLWNYQQKKSPAEFDHLMARVKDGTINVPLNTLVSCYGAQPMEAVLRGFYYAGRLERQYNVRFPTALAMENQTLPLGLSSLFAGSGAKYSWRGVCGCVTKIQSKALGNRPNEIYWYTGHDGQRVLLKWYSLGPKNVGDYCEAGSPYSTIKFVERDPAFLSRYVDPVDKTPYSVVGLFGYGGDDLERKTGVEPPPAIAGVPYLHGVVSSPYCDDFFKVAKDMTTPTRKVIVSNEQDFFKDFESHYAQHLPSQCVTYGNEWDLYSASMSETSARVKRAVEKLRAAELLSTLVSRKYPDFMKNHIGARERAFNSLGLYWEHDWTADGQVSRAERAAWEQLQAENIDFYVNSIYAEAMIRLGGMIPRPSEKSNRFFVLNSLGWPRTEFADCPYRGSTNVHVRDLSTGKDVPHQFVKIGGPLQIRILASDVPAAGYKVYEILPGPGDAPKDDAATVSGDDQSVIENAAVKLVVAHDGAIRSFIDKTRGSIELAGNVGGQYLNDFAPNSDDGEPFKIENRGPVSVTLRARSEAGLDHTTAITLYRNSDRVDIRNEITSNFSDIRYWAFSCALKDPSIHTEEVGAINLDKLQSDGGDYANTQARYDHVTLNHFADLTDASGNFGLTLSNPDLAFARLGNSTAELLDTHTPQLNVLAGGQIDGSWLGIRDQNGASYFLQRFALRAHGKYDPVSAMKFALEHQNPLVGGIIISKHDTGPYPETSYSLLSISDPSVLLWAVKPAEEGIDKGIIVRLWNLSDQAKTTSIRLERGIAAATRTTHVETDLDPVPLNSAGELPASFTRQQIQTYRLLSR